MKYASILLVAGCLLTAVDAQWLETTVSAGTAPIALCYNPQDNRVYCANVNGGTVTVIDGADNHVRANVQAGVGPAGLCYDSGAGKVYCASYSSGDVTVIEGATDSVIATVVAGSGATSLCYNPRENRVYCANFFAGTVTIVDAATDTVIGDAFTHGGPWGLCYNSLTDEVYCTSHDSLGGYVTIVDGPHGSIDIALGSVQPNVLLYDDQHNKVFCNGSSDSVFVIDGTMDSVVAGIKVGASPCAFCYNAKDGVLYCANRDSNTVTVIGAATNEVAGTIAVGSQPRALCYDSAHNKVYCANEGSNDVTVIEGTSDTVICSIAVGDEPWALAYNPTDGRVYAANRGSNDVSVIRDTSTGIEESTRPQAPTRNLAATVIHGLPPGAVIFDATGRRALNPRSGVFFVQERSAASREPSAISLRKVIIPR